MPWLSKADAARALGVSSRTLTRGLADGMLDAKRDGPHVLVHVRDDISPDRSTGTRVTLDKPRRCVQEPPTEQAQQPVETAADSDRQPHEEVDTPADALAAIREAHAAFEETAAIARLGAQQAVAAQQRTAAHLKSVGTLLVAVVVIGALVAGWSAWQYDSASASHPNAPHELGEELANVRADVVVLTDAIQQRLDADREATARAVREMEERLLKARDRTLEFQRQSTGATLSELDERFSGLLALLSSVQGGQDEIACELGQLSAELAKADLERARLAHTIDVLMYELTQTDPVPTLRDVIDKDWDPRR